MNISKDVKSVAKEIESVVNTVPINPVVVFNSHITALAVARSLGSRGVPVVALDHDSRGLALYSKYVKVRGICPNPLSNERELIEFLLEMGRHFNLRPVLFPCMDEWVLAVTKNRKTLATDYAIPFPDYELVDGLLNKSKLYRTASKLGIPTPITYDLSEMPAEKVAHLCPYPLVFKPYYKRDFYDKFHASVIRVNERSEFFNAFSKVKDFPVLAQEVVPIGPRRLYTFGSCLSTIGQPLGKFVGRRLEIFPVGFGTTCLVETANVPEIEEQGLNLLKEFGYWGISEVEFIQDERDGRFKVLDVNTRPWKWIGLASAAGVDLPHLAYLNALGKSLQAPRARTGIGWVYIKDYIRLLKQRGEIDPNQPLTGTDMLSLAKKKLSGYELLAFGVYDSDDPKPFEKLTENPEQWDEGPDAYYCPC